MKFTKDPGATAGTSLKGYTQTTLRQLIEVFGEPDYYDEGDKVTVEWCLVFEDGTVASIYDWKRYELGTPELDEIYEWHVGGSSNAAVHAVHEQLGSRAESYKLQYNMI
jgi:hypothetical protein